MVSDPHDLRPVATLDDDVEEQSAAESEWNTLSEDDRLAAFEAMPRGEASEFFLSLSHADQEALISALPPAEARVWLRLLPADDAADLIQEASEEQRDGLLALLDHRTRPEVEALLAYQADVAGGRMNPAYTWLHPDMTVQQALAYLRLQSADRQPLIYYAYVLDRSERLVGVVSFRELISASASVHIEDVMLRDVIAVHEDTDQEQVARVLQDTNLLAVPVLDDEGHLKGIITHDDVIDVLEEEATEDFQKVGGVEALDQPYFRTDPLEMLRKRGGWLALLFVGEMLTASAMGFFEHEIATAVVLALFVPLVISSGGNSGSQASTLVIRAMALGEVRIRDWARIMQRELLVGLGLGAILALLGAVRIVVWETAFDAYGGQFVGLMLTLSVSLVGVVAWGTLVGSMLPLLLRRAGFDPANASTPFVATLCDVTGLLIYFSCAKIFLLG